MSNGSSGCLIEQFLFSVTVLTSHNYDIKIIELKQLFNDALVLYCTSCAPRSLTSNRSLTPLPHAISVSSAWAKMMAGDPLVNKNVLKNGNNLPSRSLTMSKDKYCAGCYTVVFARMTMQPSSCKRIQNTSLILNPSALELFRLKSCTGCIM